MAEAPGLLAGVDDVCSVGDALAVWQHAGGDEAFRVAGGSWQTPGNLDVDGGLAAEPCVAMNEGGEAVALWESANAEDEPTIEAAIGSATDGWGAPASLLENPEPRTLGARGCHVAINAAGEAVAVWSLEEIFEFDVIYAAYKPAGGEWQAPVQLRAASEPSGESDVAINAAGDAEAVWDGRKLGIEGEYKPAGGDWQEPDSQTGAEQLSEQHVGRDPEVAFDASGEAVATWGLEDGASESIVQASDRPAGGGWQSPVDLSQVGQDAYLPQQLAVDADGEALALWGMGEGGQRTIQAAQLRTGGDWQPAVELSGAGEEALYPELAMNAEGAAVAVWEAEDAEGFSVRGAARSAGGDWQAPVSVSQAAGEDELFPQVAIDSQGDAVAAWQIDDGSSNPIQAAGYQAGGARLQNLVIPSTASVGQPVVFSASLFDVWAGLASMDWSFGDGGGANGADVAHTYTTPGVYQVSVTGEDALGNTSSATSTTTSSTTTTSTSSTTSHSTSRPARSAFTVLGLRAKPGGTITVKVLTSPAGRLSVCATVPAAKGAHAAAHDACRASVAGRVSLYGARLYAHPGTRTITLKPGRAARAALKRRHKLRVLVTITFTPASGGPRSKTKTITVTAKRR